MKKLLTILLSVLCLFSIMGISICADEDTTQTITAPVEDADGNLSYTTSGDVKIQYLTGESYTWTISAELITAVKDGTQPTVDVSITDWNINDEDGRKVCISVASNSSKDNHDDSWFLTDTYGKTLTANYKVTGSIFKTDEPVVDSGNTVTWEDDTVLVWAQGTKQAAEAAKSITGTFVWNTAAPTSAGKYEDTLTFTASIVPGSGR
ncbi:MAG: hypothetical protein Q4E33_05775 [Erysipelotrichaceae bacterium]|nr:hypothetical protein [Erysipelotrichaceae bacterium]